MEDMMQEEGLEMENVRVDQPSDIDVPKKPASPIAPKAVKGKGLFAIGAVGAVLLAVASMTAVVYFAFNQFYWYYDYEYPIFFIAVSILIFAGVLVHSFAYLGFYAHHKSYMGLATFITLVIISILFIAIMAISPRDYSGWGWYSYIIDPFLVWVASILLGVGVIVMAIALIVARKYLAAPNLYMASGCIHIIAGSFIISLLLAFFLPVGWILLFVGSLLATIALFVAIPNLHKRPVWRPPMVPVLVEPGSIQTTAARARFCPECGGRIDGAKFCPFCGGKTSL
ncbi:MAG: hypothetical protein JSV43_06935 [Methanobacteriota archaeon]|nr:MAG: hypothetical protein JSV43_06935 [Euryarchaeota archaeon]